MKPLVVASEPSEEFISLKRLMLNGIENALVDFTWFCDNCGNSWSSPWNPKSSE